MYLTQVVFYIEQRHLNVWKLYKFLYRRSVGINELIIVSNARCFP